MAVIRRVYLYSIALVALGMLIAGLVGLLEVGLTLLVERLAPPLPTIGPPELRSRVSLSGSLTALGLVFWVIHWSLADRSARRGGEQPAGERHSAIRQLFLYGTLALGGLYLTLAGARLVGDLLRAAFGSLRWSDVLTGALVQPLALLVIWTVFWLYYNRVAREDRRSRPEAGIGATLRRWYVYGLSLFGLLYFLFATAGLIRSLWEAVVVPSGVAMVGGEWLRVEVATRIGRITAGLTLWALLWSWSITWFHRATGPNPESRSVLRKVYLYLVLAVAVAWTAWNVGRILYQILRAALIPDHLAAGGPALLRDLGPAVAAVSVFGITWVYHARVVLREAALLGERRRSATIRWFYDYLVALVGLLVLAIGLAGVVATLIDLAAQPGAVRPTHWWAERSSLFATLTIVGLPLWLTVWRRIEQEAREPLARQSLVRRLYLFLVFGLAVLTLLGSGAFAVYQAIRFALGEPWTSGQTSDLIDAVSAATVAGIFLAYHVRIFRRDLQRQPPGASSALTEPPVVGLALVRTANRALWQDLQRDLPKRLPPGVELELRETDPDAASRIWAGAKTEC